MSRNRLELIGLDALLTALRSLPEDLTHDAQRIVQTRASNAESRIKANYNAHRHTGTLADSVGVRVKDAGRFGVGAIVLAAARHAHLFEFGTAARQRSGGRSTGIMPKAPPLHAFVPVMEHERREMYEDLAELLERNGLEVTGRA